MTVITKITFLSAGMPPQPGSDSERTHRHFYAKLFVFSQGMLLFWQQKNGNIYNTDLRELTVSLICVFFSFFLRENGGFIRHRVNWNSARGQPARRRGRMSSQSDAWINHQGMQITASVPCVHSQHPVPGGVDADSVTMPTCSWAGFSTRGIAHFQLLHCFLLRKS